MLPGIPNPPENQKSVEFWIQENHVFSLILPYSSSWRCASIFSMYGLMAGLQHEQPAARTACSTKGPGPWAPGRPAPLRRRPAGAPWGMGVCMVASTIPSWVIGPYYPFVGYRALWTLSDASRCCFNPGDLPASVGEDLEVAASPLWAQA